ncbi:MAG: hypothetical protein Q9162_002369 [Coniocarpon cinnabarinum]
MDQILGSLPIRIETAELSSHKTKLCRILDTLTESQGPWYDYGFSDNWGREVTSILRSPATQHFQCLDGCGPHVPQDSVDVPETGAPSSIQARESAGATEPGLSQTQPLFITDEAVQQAADAEAHLPTSIEERDNGENAGAVMASFASAYGSQHSQHTSSKPPSSKPPSSQPPMTSQSLPGDFDGYGDSPIYSHGPEDTYEGGSVQKIKARAPPTPPPSLEPQERALISSLLARSVPSEHDASPVARRDADNSGIEFPDFWQRDERGGPEETGAISLAQRSVEAEATPTVAQSADAYEEFGKQLHARDPDLALKFSSYRADMAKSKSSISSRVESEVAKHTHLPRHADFHKPEFPGHPRDVPQADAGADSNTANNGQHDDSEEDGVPGDDATGMLARVRRSPAENSATEADAITGRLAERGEMEELAAGMQGRYDAPPSTQVPPPASSRHHPPGWSITWHPGPSSVDLSNDDASSMSTSSKHGHHKRNSPPSTEEATGAIPAPTATGSDGQAITPEADEFDAPRPTPLVNVDEGADDAGTQGSAYLHVRDLEDDTAAEAEATKQWYAKRAAEAFDSEDETEEADELVERDPEAEARKKVHGIEEGGGPVKRNPEAEARKKVHGIEEGGGPVKRDPEAEARKKVHGIEEGGGPVKRDPEAEAIEEIHQTGIEEDSGLAKRDPEAYAAAEAEAEATREWWEKRSAEAEARMKVGGGGSGGTHFKGNSMPCVPRDGSSGSEKRSAEAEAKLKHGSTGEANVNYCPPHE